MGRGDKRTRRGKIFAASFGVSRKRKSKKAAPKRVAAAPAKKAPVKKGK
jgi:ribosomal small subunit protein bTHX